MRIAFIGGGNMGEAMLSAVLDKGLAMAGSITVGDIDEARHQHLERKYGVVVLNSNRQAVGSADVVVLAIKPQNSDEVTADLGGHLKPTQLVLSIIAGVRTNTLCQALNHGSLVRVMPNTPAQIGEGISVWTATAEVTKSQREWTGSILRTMGKEIYVDDEKYIDMATAVSGSGPAYIFLLMESLVDAAVHIGLPRQIAQELVLQTVLGSGHFVRKSGKLPAELRRMVTSPGGTTTEALLELEKGEFANLVAKAVSAAYNKAKRLGDK